MQTTTNHGARVPLNEPLPVYLAIRHTEPGWGDSEAQLRRLRDWYYNYEGIDPKSAKETVDLFTARYLTLRKLAGADRRHEAWWNPDVEVGI